MEQLNNRFIRMASSVDDLRCTLKFILPLESEAEGENTIIDLCFAIAYESSNYNRTTVIKMYTSKLKLIHKLMTDNIIKFDLKVTHERGLYKIVKRRTDSKGVWHAFGTRRYVLASEADRAIDRIMEQFPKMYSKYVKPEKSK